MRIGELAARARCQVETIRYYERQGLLPKPARSGGNFRIYGELHVERLLFVRRCRSLDMTLEEIGTLLRFRDMPEYNCQEVNQLLDEHIGHVSKRVAELKELQKHLKLLRQLCIKVRTTRDCGILNELAQHSPQQTRRAGHVHGTHVFRNTR
jgi:Cd(II)/Pb(II)-responsive transcriptional regulator